MVRLHDARSYGALTRTARGGRRQLHLAVVEPGGQCAALQHLQFNPANSPVGPVSRVTGAGAVVPAAAVARRFWGRSRVVAPLSRHERGGAVGLEPHPMSARLRLGREAPCPVKSQCDWTLADISPDQEGGKSEPLAWEMPSASNV